MYRYMSMFICYRYYQSLGPRYVYFYKVLHACIHNIDQECDL